MFSLFFAYLQSVLLHLKLIFEVIDAFVFCFIPKLSSNELTTNTFAFNFNLLTCTCMIKEVFPIHLKLALGVSFTIELYIITKHDMVIHIFPFDHFLAMNTFNFFHFTNFIMQIDIHSD